MQTTVYCTCFGGSAIQYVHIVITYCISCIRCMLAVLHPPSIAFSDYVGGPYVVDFPANETTVRLQIAIMDDTVRCECSEDFTASLEVPAAAGRLGVVTGVNDTAEVIIIDDDCELMQQ